LSLTTSRLMLIFLLVLVLHATIVMCWLLTRNPHRIIVDFVLVLNNSYIQNHQHPTTNPLHPIIDDFVLVLNNAYIQKAPTPSANTLHPIIDTEPRLNNPIPIDSMFYR